MNRSDLVTELAARFGQLTQRDVEAAVDAIIDAMCLPTGAIKARLQEFLFE